MEERLQRQVVLAAGMGCFIGAITLQRGTTHGLLRTLSTILPLLLLLASLLAMGIPYGKKNVKQQRLATAIALAVLSGALLIPNITTGQSGLTGLAQTVLFILAATCYIAASRSVLGTVITRIRNDPGIRKAAIIAATFSVAGACGLYLYNSLILYSIMERIPQASTAAIAFLIVTPLLLLSLISVAAAILICKEKTAGATLFIISGVIQTFFLAYAAEGLDQGPQLSPLSILIIVICALSLAFHVQLILNIWRTSIEQKPQSKPATKKTR